MFFILGNATVRSGSAGESFLWNSLPKEVQMDKILVWFKPGAYGAIGGAIVWWIVLSSGFGWMSAGASAKLAEQTAQTAVVAYAVPACVARFEEQKNPVDAWKALNKTESWSRSESIQKAGWVAEPNQKLSYDLNSAIGSACTEQIMALKALGGVQLSAAK